MLRVLSAFFGLCFAWHVAAPPVVLALAWPMQQGGQITRQEGSQRSTCLVQTLGAQQLIGAPEKQRLRHYARVQPLGRLSVALAADEGSVGWVVHRPRYPARRWLRRRLIRSAGGEQPA